MPPCCFKCSQKTAPNNSSILWDCGQSTAAAERPWCHDHDTAIAVAVPFGVLRATTSESQNSKHDTLCALTARFSWARSRRTVPIFALSESAPQKGG